MEKLQSSPSKLLVDREQAAEIIGCSAITIRRIESDGSLEPILLRPGLTSKTYYWRDDVIKFAKRGVGKRTAVKKNAPK